MKISMIEGILNGERGAEELFARQFHPRLLAMCRVRLRNEPLAQDLAQDSLLACLEALRKGELRNPEKLAAFVHGVARNIVNNHFRRRQAEPAYEELREELRVAVMPQPAEAGRRAAVEREIAALDPLDRQILQMTLVDGLKPGEIAQRLNLSGDVVRQRKLRATRRIAEKI
jgi:RNA polymerase sigma-70 factor (ECF subfamily)